MKFGQTLERRAPPEYAIHNIDYDDLKHVIKLHTTTDASKPRTIPTAGNVEREEQDFEDQFFSILQDQHGRVNDFVHMKSGEIERRLSSLEKQVSRIGINNRAEAHQEHKRYTRLQKATRVDHKIHLVGKDIQSLSQLSNVNSLAFRKILKKYRKWTKSSNLERRFRQAVLNKPSNLLNQGFDTLLAHYAVVLESSRAIQDESSNELKAPIEQKSEIKEGPHDTAHIAQKLFTDTKESPSNFDAALATYPLSKDGLRATYWVHCENLLNVQILLLRYASPWRAGHLQEHGASHSSSRPSLKDESSTTSTPSKSNDQCEAYDLILCDDIPRFVARRGSETVQDTERRSGRANEKAAAALRMSKADKAVMSLFEPASSIGKGRRSWDFENIEIQKSECLKLFGTYTKPTPSDEGSPEFLKIRQWFAAHSHVRPLVKLSSRRSRFCGVSNSSHGGLWITLDENIRMLSCTKKSLVEDEAAGEKFPHAILEVRLDGKASEASDSLIRTLDQSHYLERVRGFSLETHAVFKLHKPSSMPPPLWLAALDKDIRKVPGVPSSQQQTRVGRIRSHGANQTASQTSASDPSTREGGTISLFSQKQGESSATSAPATQERLVISKLPQKSGRQSKTKKKSKPSRQTANSPQLKYQSIDAQTPAHYWNEFDDGSEGDHDDTYAIYVDPDAAMTFPGIASLRNFFEKCSNSLSFSKEPQSHSCKDVSARDMEREPLIGSRPSLDNSDDSDDQDDDLTLRPPRNHSVSSGSKLYLDSRRERMLHLCCVSTYMMAFFLLILSGVLLVFERGDVNQRIGEAVVVFVLLSFFAVVIGSGCMVARKSRMSWLYRGTILLADVCVLVVGILFLVVIANPLR